MPTASARESHLVDSFSVSAFRTEIPLKHLGYIRLIRELKESNTIPDDFHELIYDGDGFFSISIMNDEPLRVAIEAHVDRKLQSMRTRVVSNDDFGTHLSYR